MSEALVLRKVAIYKKRREWNKFILFSFLQYYGIILKY